MPTLYALKYKGKLYTKHKRQNAFTRLRDAKSAQTRLAKVLVRDDLYQEDSEERFSATFPIHLASEEIRKRIKEKKKMIPIVKYEPKGVVEE